jgi:DNA mismatch repair protein MutS
VNDRARQVLAWLEAQHQSANEKPGSQSSTNGQAHRPAGQWQLTLFGVEEHPLLDEIRTAQLDAMRPLEALELLHSWQQRLSEERSSASPTRVGEPSIGR